jgi:hypothetical protein
MLASVGCDRPRQEGAVAAWCGTSRETRMSITHALPARLLAVATLTVVFAACGDGAVRSQDVATAPADPSASPSATEPTALAPVVTAATGPRVLTEAEAEQAQLTLDNLGPAFELSPVPDAPEDLDAARESSFFSGCFARFEDRGLALEEASVEPFAVYSMTDAFLVVNTQVRSYASVEAAQAVSDLSDETARACDTYEATTGDIEMRYDLETDLKVTLPGVDQQSVWTGTGTWTVQGRTAPNTWINAEARVGNHVASLTVHANDDPATVRMVVEEYLRIATERLQDVLADEEPTTEQYAVGSGGRSA